MCVFLKFVAASVFLLSTSSTALAAAPQSYVNENWGFSVMMPSGRTYETDPPPAPNHGFRIPTSEQSFVWVNGESTDDESLVAAAATQQAYWAQSGCHELHSNSTALDGHQAQSVLLACPAGKNGAGKK